MPATTPLFLKFQIQRRKPITNNRNFLRVGKCGKIGWKNYKAPSKSTLLGTGFSLSQISSKRSYSETSKRDFPCLLKSTRFAGNIMKPYFKSTVLHVSVSLGQVFNKECDEQSLEGRSPRWRVCWYRFHGPIM